MESTACLLLSQGIKTGPPCVNVCTIGEKPNFMTTVRFILSSLKQGFLNEVLYVVL